MPYEVKSAAFNGPLEKLLDLIESERMEVNAVSMAKVTDGFLKYLEGSRVDLRVLADFIAVASKLILLKSKYLLPGMSLTPDEEADIKDLEARLERYRSLKPALAHLHKLWRANHRAYSRPYFLGRGGGAGTGVFYPGGNTGTAGMRAALERIFDTVKAYAFETETIREKIVTLEEKIAEVAGRMKREAEVGFGRLSAEKSREELIVLFLAILHLARERLIILDQAENFSDIMVRKNGVV